MSKKKIDLSNRHHDSNTLETRQPPPLFIKGEPWSVRFGKLAAFSAFVGVCSVVATSTVWLALRILIGIIALLGQPL